MILTKRSKFLVILAAWAVVLVGPSIQPERAQAQIEKDTTHWNDEDLYDEDHSAPSFFSVGGGIMAGYFMPNLGDFNKNIAQPFSRQDIKESVFMLGGAGFVTLPWVKNMRVGGMGYSGAAPCGCTTETVQGAEYNRLLEYRVGYGAVTLDYVLPLRTGRFHIVPGVALGAGQVNIFMRQAQNRSGVFDVSNEFPVGGSSNITHTYTSNFFLYMPQLQFEYSPLGYMMMRLSAGYQGTAMGDWHADRDVTLGDTSPLKNVNGSGLIVNFGLFFGLFQ